MKKGRIVIRSATEEDAEQLLSIYRPYVQDTAITFEYTVPSVEEFQNRISRIQERYPYLVAQAGEQIVGYAYAGPFVGRAAYDWSVEMSIYLRMDQRHHGIGRQLYEALERILQEMHVLNVNACIGFPKTEDMHLDKNSVMFHTHLGYQMVGRFHDSGYKFGRWYDMVWMEKMLGDHPADPKPVLSYHMMKNQIREKYGIC